MKLKFILNTAILLALIFLFSCHSEDARSSFEVSGKITNNIAKTVYLEEMPAGGTDAVVVDSARISNDGKYHLKTGYKESLIYGLRLDDNMYSMAYVINDEPKITLDVELKKDDTRFAEKYDVKGSPASEAMKDYLSVFTSNLDKIYDISKSADSLRRTEAADSLLLPLVTEWKSIADNLKTYTLSSIRKTDNPALVIFELGYYMATDRGFGLEPLNLEDQSAIINELATRYPAHSGVKAVKNSIDRQLGYQKQRNQKGEWVGKTAPEFTLPDVNGKEVSLSSFRGKYVLVDFWASWCGPCREENPNVVKAYKEFKDKNFTVLGVSLDRPGQKDKWLEAIRNDNLNWTHVSDLKYWSSSIVSLYHLEGIPYNILVDPEGKVIAEDLKGDQLATKLEEVL